MRSPKKDYPYQNRSLPDLPGERWLDIPGFDGIYEISSLGRTKSLRRWRATGADKGYYTREMIMSQHVRVKKNHLMNELTYTVGNTLKHLQKSISRSTARYVYHAFVAPFDLDDKTIMISYKDGDGRNLDFRNLVLTDRSELANKSIRLKRTRSKFQELSIPIRQMTMTGKVVATYPSLTAASQKTGIHLSGLSACVVGRIYQYHGFRWEPVEKKEPVPVPDKIPSDFFNAYLWEKLGKPKTSRKQPIAALNLHPDSMPGEEWKPITGTNSAYFISNFGRVKGAARFKSGRLQVWTKEKIKRLIPDGNARRATSCLTVHLSENGRKFQQSVARLVYHHFVEKIDFNNKLHYIRYKNGKCYDLHPQNLLVGKE